MEIFRESIKRNSTHGYQLDEQDKKRAAIIVWKNLAHLDDPERYQELMDLFSVKKRTVENWTKDVREEEKEEKKARAWNLWLDCWSQEAIAEAFGIVQKTVSDWLSKMRSDAEITKAPSSQQHFDVWSFPKLDDSAGGKIFGRMPAQVVENLLWLNTDVGSVVVDPFAGSGTITPQSSVSFRESLPIHCHHATFLTREKSSYQQVFITLSASSLC